MRNTYIQLVDANEGYLDIKEGTVFPMSFSIADIRDISKRTGSNSKTITLVGSKNNHNLLGHYYDVNIEAGTFNINTLQRCLVVQDGIVILDNMYLQLVGINKRQDTNSYEEFIEYEVLIKDSTSDFFTTINGRELTDLDFSDFNTTYNVSNISASFDNTWEDGIKFLIPYAPNSYSSGQNVYDISEIKPAIYAKQYWDRIFSNAGYSYEFDQSTDNDIRFDKLIIPYNGGQVLSEPTTNIDYSVQANYSGTTTLLKQGTTGGSATGSVSSGVTINLEVLDDQNQYNPATGVFTSALALIGYATLQFAFNVTYSIEIINNDTVPVELFRNGNTGGFYPLQLQPIIRTTKTTGTPFSQSALFPLTTVAIGQNFSTGTTTILTATTISRVLHHSNVSIGDTFAQSIHLTATDIFQLYPIRWVRASNNNITSDVDIRLNVLSIGMTITPSAQGVTAGSQLVMNNFVPKKIKQSDFIKSICQMYNLYIQVDNTNSRNLIIKTRDEFYDSGESSNRTDWTQKLNKDRDQDLQFLPELSAKKLILSYKDDDSDESLKLYKETTNETYGQVEYTFENEYIKNIDRKDLIFSPTAIKLSNFQAYLPVINGIAPSNNIRILLDGGEINTPSGYGYFITEGDNPIALTSYPHLSHFDQPLNPSFDINYALNDYYYYNTETNTNNNLYNLHWRRTLGQINNGKLLTALFDLTPVDIQGLKLNDKIRIDNSYWNINKIIDYDVNSTAPTKVELISIDDDLILPPFQTKVVAQPILTDPIVNSPDKPFQEQKDKFKNVNGGNTTINGTDNFTSVYTTGDVKGNGNIVQGNIDKQAIVYGDDNIVNSSAFVVGSNNVVAADITNTYILTDGYTATTDNTLVTPNTVIVYGDNPSINGFSVNNLGIWTSGTSGNYSIKSITDTTTDTGSDYSLAAGDSNVIDALSDGSTILNGNNSSIVSDTNSAIVGGTINNLFNGGNNFIGGGAINSISSTASSGIFVGGPNSIDSSFSSAIIAGTNNVLNNVNNSVIIGGNGITGTSNNTVYVPFLNIRNLGTGATINNLGIDANGFVVESTGGTPTSSTWAQVLANGNTSGGNDAIISDGDVIKAANGGGEINLRYGANDIVAITTDNGAYGESILYMDPTYAELSSYGGNIYMQALTSFELFSNTNSSLLLGYNNASVSLKAVGAGAFAGIGVNTTSDDQDVKVFDNQSGAGTSGASNKRAVFIGTNNSMIASSVINSAVIGGGGNTLSASNSAIIAASGVTGTTLTQTLYNQDNYHDAYHTVTTTNATITTIDSFTPTNGVYIMEYRVTAFESATGDALGATSFATFKVIGGVVTQVNTTTLDRKSNFPAAVTVTLDTDGTIIRCRVTGRAGSTIVWRSHRRITK